MYAALAVYFASKLAIFTPQQLQLAALAVRMTVAFGRVN